MWLFFGISVGLVVISGAMWILLDKERVRVEVLRILCRDYRESLDSVLENRYQTFLDYPDATEKFKQHLYN